MNSDPAYALQVGVVAALTGSADLIAYFAGPPRVWDRVPADATTHIASFPYMTIGEDQLIPQTNQNTDCTEAFVKVEIWSRANSKGEVKRLAGMVRAALDRPIDLVGHEVITHTAHGVIYRREADGLTERAIYTQRYQTGPSVKLTPY